MYFPRKLNRIATHATQIYFHGIFCLFVCASFYFIFQKKQFFPITMFMMELCCFPSSLNYEVIRSVCESPASFYTTKTLHLASSLAFKTSLKCRRKLFSRNSSCPITLFLATINLVEDFTIIQRLFMHSCNHILNFTKNIFDNPSFDILTWRLQRYKA